MLIAPRSGTADTRRWWVGVDGPAAVGVRRDEVLDLYCEDRLVADGPANGDEGISNARGDEPRARKAKLWVGVTGVCSMMVLLSRCRE
jgi:hypothetical protein